MTEKPTPEEVAKALTASMGQFSFVATRFPVAPNPDIIKLFNWLEAEFGLLRAPSGDYSVK